MTEYRDRQGTYFSFSQASVLHDPENAVLAAETAELLGSALRSALTARQRSIVRLHYVEGLGWTAIAGRLGVSDAAVLQAHGRAIKSLQHWFDARGIRSLLSLL